MPALIKKTITWLHLSDFHIRSEKEWEQDVVLKSLVEDIKARFSGGDRPDLLLLTGDIAYSGNDKEYELAEKFIHSLIKVIGLNTDCVFVVPGNHDIDRSAEEDAFAGARTNLRDSNAVDRFLSNPGRRSTLFKRQKAFRDFVNRLAPPTPNYSGDSFSHTKTVSIGSMNVKVLLLDSSWLAEGGEKDRGCLILGERQVISTCENGGPPAITLALAHHPISWLQDFEQSPIENLLAKHASIFFHGHIHRDETHVLSLRDHRIAILTAGATFESRLSENRYGWGRVDLTNGTGRTSSFRYVPSEFAWAPADNQEWQLVDPDSISIPVDQAIRVISNRKGLEIEQPAYMTCLLTGHVSEIPTALSGRLLQVSIDSEIRGDSIDLREPVLQLRQLFRWRSVWDSKAWEAEVDRILRQCQSILNDLKGRHSDLSDQLVKREETCLQIIEHMGHELQAMRAPLLGQVIDLGTSGEVEQALAITSRALASAVLEADERLQLRKHRISLLLQQNNIADALTEADALIDAFPKDPESHHLASACSYSGKNYSLASKHMHKALDLGIDPTAVKTLALQIAGQSGDKALVARVTHD